MLPWIEQKLLIQLQGPKPQMVMHLTLCRKRNKMVCQSLAHLYTWLVPTTVVMGQDVL